MYPDRSRRFLPLQKLSAAALLVLPLHAQHTAAPEAPAPAETATAENHEPDLLSHIRQLTLGGLRAGEGYYSADGKKLIFQSERQEDNPFYQIYLLDLETGDTKRVSNGVGKTTCAWLNPDGKRALFASTHEDPEAAAKQKAEFEERASGKERRYSWDYDPTYEIYETDLESGAMTRLTNAPGYDAEASYSPDGTKIAFASNRAAYAGDSPLDPAQTKMRDLDPSRSMDLYIMDADGSNVKRLTDVDGYDGGPFFSADGSKICWRRFSTDGATAEIWTMNVDGSDQKPLTALGAMSWAPYFHPSGEYLIFTNNTQGFANFELFLVRADGKGKPVRVTWTDGFDGLPVFSPDGNTLSWTSNRNAAKQSQIYVAEWNHEAARKALDLTGESAAAPAPATGTAAPSPVDFSAEITVPDIRRHITWLASDELRGRLTGTAEEKLAAAYLTESFQASGLKPGWKGEWEQVFSFTSGVALGADNSLVIEGAEAPATELENNWRPLSFSQNGKTESAGVVFAGYGIETPDSVKNAYSSYAHLDVKDKWVLILRYSPESWSKETASERAPWTSLRAKAMTARERGAKGILIASGPNAKVNSQLVPLSFDSSLSGSGITAVSISDDLANALLKPAGKTLAELQQDWDKGDPMGGIQIPDVKISASIDIQAEKREGRNVIAVLPATNSDKPLPPLIVGAHYDHLGDRAGSNSRAGENETSSIHHGADDNASGTSAILELAAYLSDQIKTGKLETKRDIIFAAWSGEELGLLGSSAFVENWQASKEEKAPLTQALAACVNLDMIGRLKDNLILQGVGSSPDWTGMIEKANVPSGLPLTLQNDPYLPTDAMVFYMRKVPVLNFFTGAHAEYHTPRDTADTIHYEDTGRIIKFAALIVKNLATSDTSPAYTEMAAPKNSTLRGGLRAYIGSIPDYAQGDVKGVKLSGVTALAPAAKAGIKAGDVIVSLDGREIQNIYDYTQVISELKIGEEVDIEVQRGAERLKLRITPGSRE